jgi:hypothetical protein
LHSLRCSRCSVKVGCCESGAAKDHFTQTNFRESRH